MKIWKWALQIIGLILLVLRLDCYRFNKSCQEEQRKTFWMYLKEFKVLQDIKILENSPTVLSVVTYCRNMKSMVKNDRMGTDSGVVG